MATRRSKKNILIVGEMPGRSGDKALMPTGDTTKRLAKLLEMDVSVMCATFKRANLFTDHVVWNQNKARANANELWRWVEYDGVDGLVLLGRRVAKAFGFNDVMGYQVEEADFVKVDVLDLMLRGGLGVKVAVLLLPHPSGRNRWYNSFENRERVRELVRRFKRWAR